MGTMVIVHTCLHPLSHHLCGRCNLLTPITVGFHKRLIESQNPLHWNGVNTTTFPPKLFQKCERQIWMSITDNLNREYCLSRWDVSCRAACGGNGFNECSQERGFNIAQDFNKFTEYLRCSSPPPILACPSEKVQLLIQTAYKQVSQI